MNLTDCVLHLKNYIPQQDCDDFIKISHEKQWQVGAWHNYKNEKWKRNNHSEVYFFQKHMFLKHLYGNWIEKYIEQVRDPRITQCSYVKVNRYEVGENMDEHVDHIRTLFEGKVRGIPIITTLGVLNDDFEGGDFTLCGEVIDLKAGDFLAFPSVFLYPHEVKPVTKGTRYSWISWWV